MALRELIEAKMEKRPPKEIEEAAGQSNVINLMDALKRSVKGGAASARASGGKGESKSESKKPARGKARREEAREAQGGRRAA